MTTSDELIEERRRLRDELHSLFNEVPTHGPRGNDGVGAPSGGSEGPVLRTGRDPLPPSISSDETYESLYRRMWEDHYGDDFYVETDIDEPRYPIVADFIWGGVIFSTGFLLGLVLGSIVGGGVW